MDTPSSSNSKVVLAAGLGAIAGGAAVLLATRAIPKMMAQFRDGMMQSMFEKMQDSGCSPSEI